MKLTFVILLAAILQTFAGVSYSQTTSLSIKLKNVPVQTVLQEVEDQSEFYFLYSRSVVDVDRIVDLQLRNVKIVDILEALFRGTEVGYKVDGRQIVLSNKIETSETETQQQKSVSGKVVDSTGSPLPGVSVVIKGTSGGTVTDTHGNFILSNLPTNSTLQFSFVGMRTQEIAIGTRSIINITLAEESIGIEEVVAVGYGVQKKVNLTGAVDNVSMKDMATRPLTNTSSALQGKIAGVYVTQNSGQPGSDQATIRIRGVGTLNNNNPLVLIDGIPGDMNRVNPMDIQDISVLKDAAASSIYGNRAANGVILITTKRGEKGKMQVEYTAYFGTQKATYLPEVLSSVEHAELYNEASVNSGKAPKYTAAEIEKYRAGNDPLFPNTNWQDVMYSPASIQNHHIRTSASSDNLSYSFSGGYLNQDGVLVGSAFKRYDFRANIDSYYLKNKKLHVGVNLAGLRSNKDESPQGTGAVIRAINRSVPTAVVMYPDGNYNAAARELAYINNGGNDNNINNNFTGKFLIDYEVIKNLKLQGSYGVDWGHNLRNRYTPSLNLYDHLTNRFTTYNSELLEANSESLSTIFNALITYKFSVNKHNLNFLSGYSEESWRNDWSNGYRKDLLSSQPELNIGDVSTQTNSGGADATGLRSYFGRFNYDWDGKYLFEANIRRDGSSRFADGLRYGNFPSFSAGWRISEESFMKDIKYISNLKVRGSWGQLGNQNINTYYAASDILETGANYTFNDGFVPGVAVTSLTNKETSWETTTQTNVGVDLDVINKFNISANYFDRNTTDILMTAPIPIILGNLKAPYQNIAGMKNTGWELSLGYNDTFAKDFQVGATLNLSHFKNTVTDLRGLGPIYGDATILTEGEAYWSFYGYEVEGIFQTPAEITAAPKQDEKPLPGDIRFKDQNGDGKISLDKDRVVIGSQVPDLLYSMQLNLGWKGFDLGAFFQGVYGVDAYSSLELTSPFFNGASSGKWLLDRWTPTNPSTTNQRVFLDSKRQGIVSTYYLEDASYLRLKNIELGYTLSKNLTSKIGISGLRVYANIQNAFTITSYKGFDPEKPASNTRSDAHPQVRISTIGVSLNF